MCEGQANPANAPGEIRGEGRLHEQRISDGNKGTHALRLHPGASGVRRRATRGGEFHGDDVPSLTCTTFVSVRSSLSARSRNEAAQM